MVQHSRTHEPVSEFLAPKRNCLCLAIFDAKNIIVGAYDDLCIRFFNLNDNSVLGYCQLVAAVVVMKPIPQNLILICGTASG